MTHHSHRLGMVSTCACTCAGERVNCRTWQGRASGAEESFTGGRRNTAASSLRMRYAAGIAEHGRPQSLGPISKPLGACLGSRATALVLLCDVLPLAATGRWPRACCPVQFGRRVVLWPRRPCGPPARGAPSGTARFDLAWPGRFLSAAALAACVLASAPCGYVPGASLVPSASGLR